MPLVSSGFKAPFLLQNGHVQTLIPALFRKYDVSLYTRERLTTPDDDFIDIDWVKTGAEKLVVICHGLEGGSHATSVVHVARYLSQNGYDVVVMNFRGCSGEMNRTLRFYHSGETGDLDFVIQHAISQGQYTAINLIGFSLGGNVVLKYAGEQGRGSHSLLSKVMAISVPCDLESSAYYMARPAAKVYMEYFLRSLKKKVLLKSKQFPDKLPLYGIDKIKTFHQFDDKYTAPIHGFGSASDYYSKSSSIHFVKDIAIPTLILNAANDPFLTPSCYPEKEALANPNLFLEKPSSGGHVGFFSGSLKKPFYTEKRALEFFREGR